MNCAVPESRKTSCARSEIVHQPCVSRPSRTNKTSNSPADSESIEGEVLRLILNWSYPHRQNWRCYLFFACAIIDKHGSTILSPRPIYIEEKGVFAMQGIVSQFFKLAPLLLIVAVLVTPGIASMSAQSSGGGTIIEGNFGGDPKNLNPIIGGDTASQRIYGF